MPADDNCAGRGDQEDDQRDACNQDEVARCSR
jgi:hypothetical protein